MFPWWVTAGALVGSWLVVLVVRHYSDLPHRRAARETQSRLSSAVAVVLACLILMALVAGLVYLGMEMLGLATAFMADR